MVKAHHRTGDAQAHSRVSDLGGQNKFLGGQDFCFHYMF